MSSQTLIDQPGLRIFVQTGAEGPRHDPYHYEEFTIERNGCEITVHDGLAEWMEVTTPTYRNRVDHVKREEMDVIIARLTGYTRREWRRFMDRKESARFRRHRGHDVRGESGYPGESFTICHTCGGEVLSSSFDIGAVI